MWIKWFIFGFLSVLAALAPAQDLSGSGHINQNIERQFSGDSTDTAKPYLAEGYYDQVAKGKPFAGELPQKFEQVLPKYQSEEFQYAESIQDRLSFFDRVMKQISRFLNSLLPRGDLIRQEYIVRFFALVGAICVAYLLYRFLFGNKIYTRTQKEEGEEGGVAFVERNLMEVDMDEYIAKALQQKDYALAVRYQQLKNIKLLAKKGQIVYDHTKTNKELLDTLSNEDLRKDFQQCTSIFNRIWFGSFPIDSAHYQTLAAAFQKFQKRWS